MPYATDRRFVLRAGIGGAAALAIPSISPAAAGRRFFERINRPIGLQLYTLGEEPRADIEGVLTRVAAIGYRDIELPGLLGLDPARIRRAANGAGLTISSLHVGTTGELSIHDEPQRLADVFGQLGAETLVVPMFPIPSGFRIEPGEGAGAAIARAMAAAGEDMWTQFALQLNERAAVLKPHGVAVGYHNHSVEFRRIGRRTGWEILIAETEPALIHFEVDIGWIVSAGQDPLTFFHRNAGRVRQAHIKDVKAGFSPSTAMQTDPTEVGSGSIDWARVLPAAYAAGVRSFYVEQEPPFAMPRVEAVTKSYQFLAHLRA